MRGVRRSHYVIYRFSVWHSREYNTYHYGFHHGRRLTQTVECGPVGDRRADRMGMDINDSLFSGDIGIGL